MLQNGACVVNGTLVCDAPGTTFVNGHCVLASSACGIGTQLVSGQCVPAADAGTAHWPRFEDGVFYCDQRSVSCPSSDFCRQRGDGVWVCMGNNPPGGYCVDSTDCANGFCEVREDGLTVCMGNGGHGAPCINSTHCRSGFCRDRGDGVHICMSNGPRGAFCSGNLDCAFGLFCADRGDGVLEVCM
jgi:hypothetical protein